MRTPKAPILSVVVPVYNEALSLAKFHDSLTEVLDAAGLNWEIIYCNDGSKDDTVSIVKKLNQADTRIKLVSLSRNFGKEYALTAGLSLARGKAAIMLDGDGQHPVELIPEFVDRWTAGARVVVGIRQNASGRGLKKLGANIFYGLFNNAAGQRLIPGSSDFRLIDRVVLDAFLTLPETDRITRGLVDWLGFDPSYINFHSKDRIEGQPNYNLGMLTRLALDSIVSLSVVPLYIFGYLGVAITVCSFLLGASVFVEQLLLNDPLKWNFTGTAMLGILILFLVGVVLMSQGILSLYLSSIHNQSKRRPLFIVDHQQSCGIDGDASV